MDFTEWVIKESAYQNAKNIYTGRRNHDLTSLRLGDAEDNTFWRDIEMYVRRAKLVGLNTLVGRQALAKGYMVYTAYVEEVIRMFGPLPVGGVPSGEIVDDAKD
jgi:hypothetical protein